MIETLRKDRKEELVAAQQARADAERQKALASGVAQVSSIRDAVLLHSPVKPLDRLMYAPLITADNAVYGGMVVLEMEEKPGLLRVRWGTPDGQTPTYAFIQVSKQTKILSPEIMRGATHIGLVGRYVQNANYKTVVGVVKTAPVLEAMYIGEPIK